MTADPAAELRGRLRAVKDPVLRSARLEGVLPQRRMIPELVRLMADPRIARWALNIPSPYRTSDGEEFVRRARAGRRRGTWLALQLLRRADGVLVGGIGLHHLDPVHGRAEIGYWIGRPYRRRGYASEATEAISRFAFRRLGLYRVEARMSPGNTASEAVARSAGFRREGRLRESLRIGATRRDEVVYGRLRWERSGRRR